jgi:hypothetical protein
MATLTWITPPRNQGQIVEVSYATDGESIFRRTLDRSDLSEVIECRDFEEGENFNPWNEAPRSNDAWEFVSSLAGIG